MLFHSVTVKALKPAEMIPDLSDETTFGFWLGNLFKMEVTSFSLYRHNIENFVTNTRTQAQNPSGETKNLHKLSSMKNYLHNSQKTEPECTRFQKAHSVIRVSALLCVLTRTQANHHPPCGTPLTMPPCLNI